MELRGITFTILVLDETLWSVTGVNVLPEHRVLMSHVLTHFTACQIAGQLCVTLSVTKLAVHLWIIKLNNAVTPNV